MDRTDTEESARLAASRERFEKLNEKLGRLRSRVGQLRDAIVELNAEQAQVAGQLLRARRAVHECADAVETVSRLQVAEVKGPKPEAGASPPESSEAAEAQPCDPEVERETFEASPPGDPAVSGGSDLN